MSTESKKSTITIDGKAYALDDLSANARSQIVNLRVTDQEIARLGLMFVYTAPLIGRMFFGPRVALLLMGINVFPFWLILRHDALPTYPGLGPPLADAHGYIQSLLFLFSTFACRWACSVCCMHWMLPSSATANRAKICWPAMRNIKRF